MSEPQTDYESLLSQTEHLRDANVDLNKEIENLELSQARLIAELGIIAQALDAEPNMTKVLAKIEELKAK